MKRRGQAAMEFLMTYGWAILAAIIVVGVLWYLIGSPANLVATQVTLTAPLVGESVAINTTDVQVELRNGVGESITVSAVNLGRCGTSTGLNTVIPNGNTAILSVTCGSALTQGDQYNEDITVSYNKTTSSTLVQTSNGRITGRVP